MVCDTCSKSSHIPTQRSFKTRTKLQSTQLQDVIKEATSSRVVQDYNTTQTSAIIPAYVSIQNYSRKEVLVYALLDSQSDCSFILEEPANVLDTNKEEVKRKLSTMSSKRTIGPSKRLRTTNNEEYFTLKKITVPTIYT